MSTPTAPPAGTRDFLPQDVRRRDFVIGRIRTAYERHGFEPLETPAMERIETLSGKYGDEGEQLIFRVLKRGEKLAQETVVDARKLADLGLRYDLTVPLARCVAEYQGKLPKFFKRYQVQPVWRADRPQKGRFREFWQCDVDYVGTTSLVAEVEVMQAVASALVALEFRGFQMRVNDRRVLTGIMEAAGVPPELHVDAITAIDKLDKIGTDGVTAELRQRGIGQPQIEALAPVLRTGPAPDAAGNTARLDELARLFAGRSATGEAGLQTLRELLGMLALVDGLQDRAVFDATLARGLSYYTGPIFELAVDGLAGSMGGGGRYDELVGMFLGHKVPAVGFSLGLERILVVMEQEGRLPTLDNATDCLVAAMAPTLLPRALDLARRLRAAGCRADVYPEITKLGNQLKFAESRAVPCCVIVGEREAAADSAVVKDLRSGQQVTLATTAVAAHVHDLLHRS